MKSWMNRYIEFLLTSHNCLVIPELGGFIVSDKFDLSHSESILIPNLTVAFNQDLKHNDGILYASIQQYEGISYEKARQKVHDAVVSLKSELNKTRSYKIGSIGTLMLNTENNLVFQPAEDYVHPSNFGLLPVSLGKLQREEVVTLVELVANRKDNRMAYVAAAIALILMFVMPVFNKQESHIQQASLIETTKKSLSDRIESLVISAQDEFSGNIVLNDTQVEVDMPKAENTSLRTYYIIIGSETSEYRRDILMKKFGEDFSDLSFVETDGRYRIYPASFDDKTTAEEYLIKFREDNPKYETAWLYSKKN